MPKQHDRPLQISRSESVRASCGTASPRTAFSTKSLTAPQRGRVVFCQFVDGGARLATIGSTADLTTLQVSTASRAGLAERLLRLTPWIP